MTFEATSVWSEVKDIIDKTTDPQLYEYKGTVHTEKEDFAVWDLSSIEIVRDYLNSVAETGKIIFRLGLGDYVRRFFPYRNNLEFTLKRIPLGDGGLPSKNKTILVVRYKVIFNPSQNPQVGGSELETYDSEDLNVSDFVEVHVEVLDRSMEPLRIKTTGGAYNAVNNTTLIHSLLGGESMKVLVDGKPAVQALDLVPPDNNEVIPRVIIPHGTKITALPTYLQHSISGVYNRGIGTFFQMYNGKKTWFVYPVYDAQRFDGADKKVVFYVVPQEKLPQLDKSYREVANILKVAVTAQRKYSDNAELAMMNEGSGYRMSDARAFMKKPILIKEDGPVATRTQLNHEVVTKERSDNLNYAPMEMNGPSLNPYVQRSVVVARNMAQVDLVWENANPELIYPGMPCKYVYISQDKPISLKGTVLFVHAFSARVEKYNASAFRTTCRITIACELQTKKPSLPSKGTANDHY